MKAPIRVGDTFTAKGVDGATNVFRRDADDLAPAFECERIQIRHVYSTRDPKMKPYTFGAEPAWFRVRGLEVEIADPRDS